MPIELKVFVIMFLIGIAIAFSAMFLTSKTINILDNEENQYND